MVVGPEHLRTDSFGPVEPSIWQPATLEQAIKHLEKLERLSVCPEKSVGCIITNREGLVVAEGANGKYWDGTACGSRAPGQNQCVHAEERAIAQVKQNGSDRKGRVLICSYSPCLKCAQSAIAMDLRSIVFPRIHRDLAGLQFALEHRVQLWLHDGSSLVEVPSWPIIQRWLGSQSQDGAGALSLSERQIRLIERLTYIQAHRASLRDLKLALNVILHGSKGEPPVQRTGESMSRMRIMAAIELEEICLREAEKGNVMKRIP